MTQRLQRGNYAEALAAGTAGRTPAAPEPRLLHHRVRADQQHNSGALLAAASLGRAVFGEKVAARPRPRETAAGPCSTTIVGTHPATGPPLILWLDDAAVVLDAAPGDRGVEVGQTDRSHHRALHAEAF